MTVESDTRGVSTQVAPSQDSGRTEAPSGDSAESAFQPLFGDAPTLTPEAFAAEPIYVDTDHLVHVLSELHAHDIDNDDKVLLSAEELRLLIQHQVHLDVEEMRPVLLREEDNAKIDIVVMLFKHIVVDPDLPGMTKAMIGRLLIPAVKVAILEPAFFSDDLHPVRQLLNEVTESCFGWEGCTDLDNIVVHRKVDVLVDRILDEYGTDSAIFGELLQDFREFIRIRQSLPVEQDDSAEVVEMTDRVIAERWVRQDIPEIATQFFSGPWKQLLLNVYHQAGADSKAWASAIGVGDLLVWSLLPNLTVQQQQNISRSLPGLMAQLARGMAAAGVPEPEQQYFLQEIGRHHAVLYPAEPAPPAAAETAPIPPSPAEPEASPAAGGAAAPETSPSVPPAAPSASQNEFPDEMMFGSARTRFEDIDEAEQKRLAPLIAQVKALRIGQWMEFIDERGESRKGKLIWKNEFFDDYTFVDRLRRVVADTNSVELARELLAGRARFMENKPLLEKAMKVVIGRSRKQ